MQCMTLLKLSLGFSLLLSACCVTASPPSPAPESLRELSLPNVTTCVGPNITGCVRPLAGGACGWICLTTESAPNTSDGCVIADGVCR